MAARGVLLLAVSLLALSSFAGAIFEDQAGLADWHHKYIGKVKQAVFHTQKTGRRRVVVLTEENVIASLDLRTGEIFWRHILGRNDLVNQLSLTLGKYVVSLSSGNVLRAWNLPDGQMVWETSVQVSAGAEPFLHVSTGKAGKDNLILVSGGSSINAVSSADGAIIWRKDFSADGFTVKQAVQSSENDIIYVLGYVGSAELSVYHINLKTGEVVRHSSESFPEEFSDETTIVSNKLFVALSDAKSKLFMANFKGEGITYNVVRISDLDQDFTGKNELLPVKYDELFAIKTATSVALLKVHDEGVVEVIQKIKQPAAISAGLSLSDEESAFAAVQNLASTVEITVKLNSELNKDFLRETIQIDQHRGRVERVFLNNYVRTDRTHGFRALIVMEDHSLLLVQQGEIVWSREDGLASIIDVTTSDLPVEREGVSVADVENSLFEWLKGHILKLKGTLMLASADELAAIQAMRLNSSEKNKMTRDHNGFRKLIIVLTRAGKILALHNGDGRVIWSHLLTSLVKSEQCEDPTPLGIYQWQVPHHHALDENPSVLIIGRCGSGSDSPGIITILDSYSGKKLQSTKLEHSIVQVVPLALTDSSEQRLHLIVDVNSRAFLYPATSGALDTFLGEMANVYLYMFDDGKDALRGYSLHRGCNHEGNMEYCFHLKELWSVAFPSENEQLAVSATRNMNEVVHTQAKPMSDKSVMYKYLSKNLLFVATLSPKAAGDIGSAAPEEAWLVAYLIDAVTGRVLHRVTHQGAQGPVHAVVSENWVVYHYFNLRAHRYEMSVIEVYDQSRAGNEDVLKLIMGKHNLTAPITSFSRPDVAVKSQSYFFSHSVKAMAVTSTAKGITTKQILIGTVGDQVVAVDKRFLDPRRSANPTQTEKEDGIIPLTDTLPIFPQSYVTHSLQVEGLRGIVAIPAKLESTTLVFSYGVDIFYTRLAPSRVYDSLTDEFNYALLLITIVALVVAIVFSWVLSERKELSDKWR